MSLTSKERLILRASTNEDHIPYPDMREYWSMSLLEIDEVMMRFKSKGYVRLVNNKWVLTPQGAVLLSGNKVRVITRRRDQ